MRFFGRFFENPSGLVGSMVQFSLANGFVYGLCTHDKGRSGQIIKMYAPTFSNKQTNMKAFRNIKARTLIHFGLKYALSQPEINIVGTAKLTKEEARESKFRSLGLSVPGEIPKGWWIIDGEKETWVDELSRKMAYYPDDGFPNLAFIEDMYPRDLYPYSKGLLARGPLGFDPDQVH